MRSETGEYIVIPESECNEKGVPAAAVAFLAKNRQAVRPVAAAFRGDTPTSLRGLAVRNPSPLQGVGVPPVEILLYLDP
jgi:hypothetical protein